MQKDAEGNRPDKSFADLIREDFVKSKDLLSDGTLKQWSEDDTVIKNMTTIFDPIIDPIFDPIKEYLLENKKELLSRFIVRVFSIKSHPVDDSLQEVAPEVAPEVVPEVAPEGVLDFLSNMVVTCAAENGFDMLFELFLLYGIAMGTWKASTGLLKIGCGTVGASIGPVLMLVGKCGGGSEGIISVGKHLTTKSFYLTCEGTLNTINGTAAFLNCTIPGVQLLTMPIRMITSEASKSAVKERKER
jgi:hypothetical protein